MPDISKVDDDDFQLAIEKYLSDNPPLTNASLRFEIATLQAKLDKAVKGLHLCLRHEFMDRCPAIQGFVRNEIQSLIKELRP